MVWAALLLFAGMYVVLAVHSSWARQFTEVFDRSEEPAPGRDELLPPAAVVVSLRGADPYLADCIRGVFNQDHPDYHVTIVVDNASDPAAEVVQQVINETGFRNVEVTVLKEPLRSCGLKVSALIQAIQSLPDRYEVVALVDADAIPYASWLRDLSRPLMARDVGAATGLRWYAPGPWEFSNMLRRQWNMFAVVQMNVLGIPWGGSLAVKRSLLRDADQLQQWTTTLCEDTPLAVTLERHNLRLKLVPEATMVNRESIGFGDFYRFMRRQLLFTRLYHPQWETVFRMGLAMAFLPLATLVMLILTWNSGSLLTTSLLLSTLAGYQVGLVKIGKAVSRRPREMLARRGESLQRCRFLPWAMFVSQVSGLMHAFGLVAARLMRRIEWRGISYVATRTGDFHMERYQPFHLRRDESQPQNLSV